MRLFRNLSISCVILCACISLHAQRIMFIFGGGAASCSAAPQTLTASNTITVPAGCGHAVFESWGGGAGGQSANPGGSAAGGGGAYTISSTIAVTPGNVWTVTVASSVGADTNGQTTKFTLGSDFAVAPGGLNNSSGGVGTHNGGASGSPSFSGAGAGGGGGAGSSGNGGNGGNGSGSTGGSAGAAGAGGGAAGGIGGNGDNSTSCTNGAPGSAPGGGGGGGGFDGVGTCMPGSGAHGQARVTWSS
jgi:hypothetical protein